MRRSTTAQFRALALIALLTVTAAPAFASPTRDDGPGFEQRIVRLINRALRHLGVSILSDEISIPKPYLARLFLTEPGASKHAWPTPRLNLLTPP